MRVNRWTFSPPSSPSPHHNFLFLLGTENSMGGHGSFAVMRSCLVLFMSFDLKNVLESEYPLSEDLLL